MTIGGLALSLLAACSVEVGGLGDPGDPARDGGVDGAVSPLDAPLDAPATGIDAPGDAGPVDSGPPPVPTPPVTLATSGTNVAHPAIAWSGAEFVLAYLVAVPGGSHVEVARMPPGAAPLPAERVTTVALPRRSVAVAPRGSQIAVAWTEDTGTEFRLELRSVPAGPSGRYGPVIALADHDDAQIVWDGTDVIAVVRRPDPGGEALGTVRFGSTMSAVPAFATAASFGDIRRAKTRSEPVILSGETREMWSLASGSATWLATVGGIPMGVEGDAAELESGDFVAVWSETSGVRTLVAAPMRRSGAGLAQDVSPITLGWDGPDPAVDAVGDRVVVAWCDETDGMRPIGVGMISADGAIVVDRCALPHERPVTNEPDIACGGGWCAIVWLEGDDYSAPDLATRVMQIPAVEDRSRFCP